MHKIACMGDNCVDYYDAAGEMHFGGNPVNVAVYCARLGHEASYIGAVGDDSFGLGMRQAISGRQVDVSHLHTQAGSTALTHVSIVDGDRVFGEYDEGVMEDFHLSDEDVAFIKGHELAVSGLWGHCQDRLQELRGAGVYTAFDCSDRPEDPIALEAIPGADIIFFSDDSSSDEQLRGRIENIAALGTPLIVLATRGVKGSLAWDGSRFYEYGIHPCPVVDTMGAGDSYIAGFLCAWLDKKPVKECMEAGAMSSAQTLVYAGAW